MPPFLPFVVVVALVISAEPGRGLYGFSEM